MHLEDLYDDDDDERKMLRREARMEARYDWVDDDECVCRWDRGDFYQPPALDVNPACPIHGDDAEQED